jgi:hypothetical protein
VTTGKIPIIATHHGVGIHDQQAPDRVAVVKAAIDQVYAIRTAAKLLAYLKEVEHPPEARLFARAKLQALHDLAREKRARHSIDLELADAFVTALDSIAWRDPLYFCSLMDPRSGAVPREEPLA